MATVSTNANLSSIDARLRRKFFEGNATIDIISNKVFRTQKTERRYEIFDKWVGVDEATAVGEGESYDAKEIRSGPTKTISVRKFGFRVDVTRELIMDSLFSPIQDSVSMSMKNSMLQTKERRCLNILNNGFGTTDKTGRDGLALFSTAHTLTQGGTQSNAASVAGALDTGTVWGGINTMRTTQGNSTLYDTIYSPKFLVVPQGLERVAHETIQSEWVPFVTENTENVVSKLYPLTVLTSPLLTSTTAWFLFANPSDVIEYGLVLLEREALQIKALFDVKGDAQLGDAVNRDIYTWKVFERYEADLIDFFGTYGNAGA